jgi:hypothetical protein
MAIGDYCTIDELKARLWPTGTTPDTDEDTMLQSVITSVSRWIDNYTGTRFYTTAADETRYLTAQDCETLFTPDIVSITTLATDNAGARTYGESWTVNTDFEVMPYNYALDGTPIRMIERTPLGAFSFHTEKKAVKIVGKFGYCTAANQPVPVKVACLIQCERIFKRKDAPFGLVVNPFGTMNVITELDPDVKQLLDMYRRLV